MRRQVKYTYGERPSAHQLKARCEPDSGRKKAAKRYTQFDYRTHNS